MLGGYHGRVLSQSCRPKRRARHSFEKPRIEQIGDSPGDPLPGNPFLDVGYCRLLLAPTSLWVKGCYLPARIV